MQKGIHNPGIGLQPDEICQKPELCAWQVSGVDRLARRGDGGRGLVVDREIEGGELREVFARRGVDLDQPARETIDFPFFRWLHRDVAAGAPSQPRIDQRHHGFTATGR